MHCSLKDTYFFFFAHLITTVIRVDKAWQYCCPEHSCTRKQGAAPFGKSGGGHFCSVPVCVGCGMGPTLSLVEQASSVAHCTSLLVQLVLCLSVVSSWSIRVILLPFSCRLLGSPNQHSQQAKQSHTLASKKLEPWYVRILTHP